MLFHATIGVLLVMRTLEDGWYVVINAYKLTILEIWGDFLDCHILYVHDIPTYRVY